MANLMKPKTFIRSSEGAVVSYNWTDLASGSGYQTYYLAKDQTGYILTSHVAYSDVILTKVVMGATGLTKHFDQVFSATLNTPRVVNGNVIVEIAAQTIEDDMTLYFIGKFVRIRGGSETVIANATGTTMTGTAGAGVNDHNSRFMISIPVTNAVFAKGDKIGVRLEGWTTSPFAAANYYILVGHDPRSRTDSVETTLSITNSILNIPFKVDN